MKKKFECTVRYFGDDFPAAQIESGNQISGDLFSGLNDLAVSKTGKHISQKGDTAFVGGKNFGHGYCGHALFQNIKNNGTVAIIANSITRDFYRGAINQGLAVIEIPDTILNFRDGESITIDMEKGEIKTAQGTIAIGILPDLHYKIYLAGGLIPYTKKLMGK